jgi:hypothetical protein
MSPGMCETRCREVQHQYPEMMRELEAAGGEETWCFGCGHSAPYATYFEDWKHAWKEWSLLGWAPLCTWFGLSITKVACIYAWKIFGGGNLYSRKLFFLCTYYQDSAGLLNSWLTLLEEFHVEVLISVSTQFQWQYPQGWSISDFIFPPFSCTDEHSMVTYKRCSPCW